MLKQFLEKKNFTTFPKAFVSFKKTPAALWWKLKSFRDLPKIYNLHTHLSVVLTWPSDARTSQPKNSSRNFQRKDPMPFKDSSGKALKKIVCAVCVPKNQTLDACPAGKIMDLKGWRLFYWWKILFNTSDESAVIISVSQPRGSLNIPLLNLSSSSFFASFRLHTAAQARWERLFLFT